MKRFLAVLLIFFFAANAEAATYTYGFGADEDPLSDSGAWQGGYTGFGNLLASGGIATVAADLTDERMTVGSIAPTNDQYAQVTLVSLTNPVSAGMILLRWTDPPNTTSGIEVVISNVYTDYYVSIYEFIAGVETPIGDAATITFTPNDVFMAVVSGSTLTVYQNKAQVRQETISSTAGRIGLGGYTDAGTLQMDDFEGGDYGVTPPVVTVRHRPIIIQ